jgi:hypothetical protein
MFSEASIRFRKVKRTLGFVGLVAWAFIEYALSDTAAEKYGELVFTLLSIL